MKNDIREIKKKIKTLRLKIFVLVFLIAFKIILYASVVLFFILAITNNALYYAAAFVVLIPVSMLTKFSKFDFIRMADHCGYYNDDIKFYKQKIKYYKTENSNWIKEVR